MPRIKKGLHWYIQEDILLVILNDEFGLQRVQLKKQLEKDESRRQAEMFGYFSQMDISIFSLPLPQKQSQIPT